MFRTLIVLAPALAGCLASNGDQGMLILNNSALSAGATGCSFTGDINQPFIASGQISTLSPVPYLLTPLIQSRISVTTMQETSDRTISLDGADVTLKIESVQLMSKTVGNSSPTPPDLSSGDSAFKALFSGSIPPNGTANVGFNLIPTTVLETIGNLATTPDMHVHATVLATVTAFGTLGSDNVTSVPFNYPVTVCNDCGIVDLGACTMMTMTTVLGNPCNVFQDGTVACCETNGQLVCPAISVM